MIEGSKLVQRIDITPPEKIEEIEPGTLYMMISKISIAPGKDISARYLYMFHKIQRNHFVGNVLCLCLVHNILVYICELNGKKS